MKAISQNCQFLLLLLSLSLLAACGSTAVMESHPSLARPGDSNAAKVYFLRSDIGYWGVMGNAFSISLDEKELLTLAKGEYALVYLQPVSGMVTVESSTVKNQGGMNVMTKVKESRPFSFDGGKTYYLAFQANQQDWMSGGGTSFVPMLITGTAVIEATNKTKAIGRALQEPIAPSKQ